MTRQKLVEKAKKVAALMSSPVEGEMIAASIKLKQLLNEHNLTLKELGLKNLNLNPTSKDVAEYNDTIIEVVNKVPYSLMNVWIRDLFVKITRAYGVRGFVSRDGYMTFVGYASDIEIVKIMAVSLRGFILSQISKRGYTDNAAVSYAVGVTDRVVKSIGSNVDPIRMATIVDYMKKNHSSITRACEHIDNFKYSCSAYNAGTADAEGYNV